MAKKHKHEEHENHERWLVSYADFITLLFAFFVVMYSVSKVDNKRLTQAAQSVQWALHYSGSGGVGAMPIFDGPPSEGGCAVNVASGPRQTPTHSMVALQTVQKKIERRLRHMLLERGEPRAVQISLEGKRLAVRLSAARFFDPAQAALRPEALPVIDAIADELGQLEKPIRVEGHTDDSQVSGRYQNNWELSAARAATVVWYLEAAHLMKPGLLSAVGHAATKPIAKNDTPEGREANRRVEMVVELNADESMALASK